MRSVGYFTLLKKLWGRKVPDPRGLWKPCFPSCNYMFPRKDGMGLLTTQGLRKSYFDSTSWRQLLERGFLILAPCIYFAVSNPISNESDSSSNLRTLSSKDLLKAAKEAASAIELKSNCILNLYSVASRSPSFVDMKQREQSAMEALSLADRWVQKLQSLVFKEIRSPFPVVDWKKWLIDVASIMMGVVLVTCIRFVNPILSQSDCLPAHWKSLPWKLSFWNIWRPMLILTLLVSLIGFLVHPWIGKDQIFNLLQQRKETWKAIQSSKTDWQSSNWEAVEDESVRHALLQLEKASLEEQDAMEKYNVLQNMFSASLLQREEQSLLEEYQYRISQAQEEIANAEARWNRWMLGIRRLDILEAIGLSTATRMAQLCDEYQQYFQFRDLGTIRRIWVNLWSLFLSLTFGKCTETAFQRYLLSEKQETSSVWNSILIGWITSMLLKDWMEVLKDYKLHQEVFIWKERAQQGMKNWLEFRKEKKPELYKLQ
ncbi:hypothetical protein GpartN1_g7192.t1 [Galdieria partita]|uniref:Uncharacterized protein n=1 Tax=Galdieria partita TaxID=83374 RepID=A0A9C7UTX5_9RHOD|nr:hypothetical protein GpartN1_g7192.t1 [Galdieria partita]